MVNINPCQLGTLVLHLQFFSGAVYGYPSVHGAVSEIENPTVRFGAVPRWTFFLRCGSTLCRENPTTPSFSTMHRMKKP